MVGMTLLRGERTMPKKAHTEEKIVAVMRRGEAGEIGSIFGATANQEWIAECEEQM
jgi:hypothetical protein